MAGPHSWLESQSWSPREAARGAALRAPRGLGPALGPALVAGVTLRVLGLLAARGTVPEGDERTYAHLASLMAQGRGFVDQGGIVRPPGYVAFLSLHAFAGTERDVAARTTQLLLSLGTMLLLCALLDRTYGRRAALVAGWLLALYPEGIGYALLLRPETLYTFLFVAATAMAFATREAVPQSRPELWRRALFCGMLFGAACLVRSLPLGFVGLVALWLVLSSRPRRRAALAGTLVVIAMLLTILPWTIRNARHFHRLLLVEATLGYNLAIGNNLAPPPNYERGRSPRCSYELCSDANLVDRDRCNARNARAFVRGHPRLVLGRVPLKLSDLWGTPLALEKRVRAGGFAIPAGARAAIARTIAVTYLSVLALAGIGLALPARHDGERRMRSYVVATLAYTTALYVAVHCQPRYHVPLMPFLLGFAALPWSDGRMGELTGRPARALAALAAGAGLAWLGAG